MDKKASMDLSVNMIVVMIICVVLLGIGIKLVYDGISAASKMNEKISSAHKAALERAMMSGSLVSTYPTVSTIQRGKRADFAVGISNELGATESFYLTIEPDGANPSTEVQPMFSDVEWEIQNTKQKMIAVGFKAEGAAVPGQYIFNICVTKASRGLCRSTNMYGDLQKVIVNVK